MMSERYSMVLESKNAKDFFKSNDVPFIIYNDMLIAIRQISVETLDKMQWKYVTRQDLSDLGKTFDELYDIAYKSDEDHGYVFEEITKNLPVEAQAKYSKLPAVQKIYIISNKEKVNGASVLMHKEYLKKISDKLGSGLILAAASTHEVYCISSKASSKLKSDIEKMLEKGQNQGAINTELIYF